MVAVALPVISMGYLAASRLAQKQVSLRLHSAFESALNMVAEDGELLTLLCARKYQQLPDAIRVDLPPGWDWRLQTRPNQPFIWRDGMLTTQRLSISLRGSAQWQPEWPTQAQVKQGLPGALNHYQTLAQQLRHYCQQQHINSVLQLLPQEWPQGLAVNLTANDSREMMDAQLVKIIGFGHGLTPDGDDYLLGYLAALWSWREVEGIAIHWENLQNAVPPRLSRTNDISRHYLARGLEGHFSEPIYQLIQLLYSNAQTTQIRTAALGVMQFGSSSGVDCLAGLLHGLRTLKATL